MELLTYCLNGKEIRTYQRKRRVLVPLRLGEECISTGVLYLWQGMAPQYIWPGSKKPTLHLAKPSFFEHASDDVSSEFALELEGRFRGVLMIRQTLERKLDHFSAMKRAAGEYGIVKKGRAYRHKARLRGGEITTRRRGWEYICDTKKPIEGAGFYLFGVKKRE